MPKVTDTMPMPGELVMSRIAGGLTACKEPDNSADAVGTVTGASLGFVVSSNVRGWTYVMWSSPTVIGWVPDGLLRRIDQRG